ncbi:hypothetical protein BpHYR1_053298 [Brachionus plicatilis]|uniref:Uncharacterized protein n=1 Tax=Brachionus plicatilis TaxID=10195 RepID=A0A3M7Q862_BRAPC|nr:hypothetical protein BpHYR1_053298 [Brachionus plicatilis]
MKGSNLLLKIKYPLEIILTSILTLMEGVKSRIDKFRRNDIALKKALNIDLSCLRLKSPDLKNDFSY